MIHNRKRALVMSAVVAIAILCGSSAVRASTITVLVSDTHTLPTTYTFSSTTGIYNLSGIGDTTDFTNITGFVSTNDNVGATTSLRESLTISLATNKTSGTSQLSVTAIDGNFTAASHAYIG